MIGTPSCRSVQPWKVGGCLLFQRLSSVPLGWIEVLSQSSMELLEPCVYLLLFAGEFSREIQHLQSLYIYRDILEGLNWDLEKLCWLHILCGHHNSEATPRHLRPGMWVMKIVQGSTEWSWFGMVWYEVISKRILLVQKGKGWGSWGLRNVKNDGRYWMVQHWYPWCTLKSRSCSLTCYPTFKPYLFVKVERTGQRRHPG